MIDLVWFKRDFRLSDHAPLAKAEASGNPTLLLFVYEPSIYSDSHYSKFHFDFIKQSINEMNSHLGQFGTQIVSVKGEIIEVLGHIRSEFLDIRLLSHEETGIDVTYQRDIVLKQWCDDNNVEWQEFRSNAIDRGRRNRKGWSHSWTKFMKTDTADVDLDRIHFLPPEQSAYIKTHFGQFNLASQPLDGVQQGGTTKAMNWLESFLSERHEGYIAHISKPLLSRTYCSRLSPYLAWGNLSVRQVYQAILRKKEDGGSKRNLSAFSSRLRWQAHFVQKFEMEPRMEFEALNKGFLEIPYEENREYIERWKNGTTGFPLVDASVRCLVRTGYLNFRMRTMITSFFCHHLFQHFSHIGPWLARNFLDFEPGIHYAQMQMQSGLTGYNTVRIYNPTKNAHDHDPEALFIKEYVPELRNLPAALAIEPWNTTKMDESLYGFDIERDYHHRIIDMSETRKHALSVLYGQRKTDLAKKEKIRILAKHTVARKPKK
ncbi:MAG: FAD-binding domain-containing protein [Pricia sp.]